MARKEHQYYYIYKTTCNVTGKYYIGMHSTSNLDDGYVGSGKRLWKSLNKHGKENHSIEILEWYSDRNSLKLREKELVNEEILNDPMCMNLVIGGGGGKISEDQQKHRSSCGGKSAWLKNRELQLSFVKKGGQVTKEKGVGLFSKENKRNTGQLHTCETKIKIGHATSIKQKGENNSQFGTRWITNGKENKKIKKNEILPNGWIFGRKAMP
jgi:hypothetical protein